MVGLEKAVNPIATPPRSLQGAPIGMGAGGHLTKPAQAFLGRNGTAGSLQELPHGWALGKTT